MPQSNECKWLYPILCANLRQWGSRCETDKQLQLPLLLQEAILLFRPKTALQSLRLMPVCTKNLGVPGYNQRTPSWCHWRRGNCVHPEQFCPKILFGKTPSVKDIKRHWKPRTALPNFGKRQHFFQWWTFHCQTVLQ